MTSLCNPLVCTLQMKGRRESNINVWFLFIYVFTEMKLLFPKQNFNFLSPSSYTHIYVRYLYIFPGSVRLSWCREICGPKIAHRRMNVEIGTEAAQFPEKEYMNGFFLAVQSAASPVSLNLLALLHLFSSPSPRGAMHQIRVFHSR